MAQPDLPLPDEAPYGYALDQLRQLGWRSPHDAPTQDAYDAACAALHKHRARADAAEAERDALRDQLRAAQALDPVVAELARTTGVLAEIAAERVRQDERWGEQNHPDGTGHWVHEQTSAMLAREACQKAAADGTVTWAHILREELYEAMAESDPAKLRAELVQVAAVAVNWIEAIDRRAAPTLDELYATGTPAATALAATSRALLGRPVTGEPERCCDSHNRHCEPPSELCCERCTEATHGMWVQTPNSIWPASHADGSTCVLAEGRTDG